MSWPSAAALTDGGVGPLSANGAARRETVRRGVSALVALFATTSVIVPVSALNKLLFIVLLLISLYVYAAGRNFRGLAAMVICAIFLYGLGRGIAGEADSALAVRMFLPATILLLIRPLLHFEVDMDRIVERVGLVLLVVTALLVMWTVAPTSPGAETGVELLKRYSLSAVAERDFLVDGSVITIALGTAPFLYASWCVVIERLLRTRAIFDGVLSVLVAIGIVLSGSRGLLVVTLAYTLVLVFFRASILLRAVFAAVIVTAAARLLPALVSSTKIFDASEFSNAGKLGHVRSYLEQLDFGMATFGEGLGSSYYSSGIGRIVVQTEVTPVDLARFVGIPLAVVTYLLLALPVLQRSLSSANQRMAVLTCVLYLLLSATNPVLFNSFGMVVVLWCWMRIFRADTREGVGRHSSSRVQPLRR